MKKFSYIICTAILISTLSGCAGGAKTNGQGNLPGNEAATAGKSDVTASPGSPSPYVAPTNLVSIPGTPVFTNRTRGANHMLQKPASDGYYYAYDSAPNDTWPIQKSKDAIHWTQVAGKKAEPVGTWGKMNFWVPQMIEFNNKYYMYYCAREDASYPSSRIGLAISDSPEGPFKDIGHPIFDGTSFEDWHIIDPEPFIDERTGKKYMYFSKDGSGADAVYYNERFKTTVKESHIYGVELSDDMMRAVGEPVLIIRPSQEWEYKSYPKFKRLWNEAPEMIQRGDTYYLMYSANDYTSADYALGVASSKSPLGPFVKQENNPVVSNTAASKKAGHNSITESPDRKEFFTSYTTLEDGRYISRIGFREDGSMYVNGPIKGYQEMPSGTTNYVNYAKEASVKASSTKPNYRLQAINDGEIGIYEKLERYEWTSNNEKAGAWVQLNWSKPITANEVLIYDSAVANREIKKGHVIINNEKEPVYVDFPVAPGDPAVVHFSGGKEITSLKFVADELRVSDGIAGLSEISVLGKKN